MKRFNDLPILSKIFLFSGILISFVILVALFSNLKSNALNERDAARLVHINMLLAQNAERNFIITRDTLEIKKVDSALNYILFKNKIIKNEELVTNLNSAIINYQTAFSSVVDKTIERGLNENSGSEGLLRKSVHSIERILQSVKQYELQVAMLSARRSEKDFFMRHRDEYIQKVKTAVRTIEDLTRASNLPVENKNLILIYSQTYLENFLLAVSAIKAQQNKIDELNTSVANMTLIVNDLIQYAENKAVFYSSFATSAIVLSILAAVLLSIFMARLISKPIIKLKNATSEFAEGKFDVNVSIRSKDEIGSLAESFNFAVRNIKNSRDLLSNYAEELKLTNINKDKFFSIIAHDLKNPLYSIISLSDLLNQDYDDFDDKNRKEIIASLSTSSQNIYTMLDNLLTWARSQRGLIEINKELISINELIKTAISPYEAFAKNKNINIIHNIEDIHFHVDKYMLGTVLGNLVNNAIKFSNPNSDILITNKVADNFIELSVQDKGVGMSPETIQKLFKIDSSFKTPGTNRESGSGLGLILCKEFVDKHDGKIFVESELNKGSIFTVTLPKDTKVAVPV